MPEFRRRGAKAVEPPRSMSNAVAKKRRERSTHIPDLRRFLADFKSGLGRLKTLTKRLVERNTRTSPIATAGSTFNTMVSNRVERHEHREVMKVLERELRLVKETAPPQIRDRVVSAFKSKAESAIQLGIPQSYARILDAVRPARALRPNQSPAVKSLLRAAKAIRSGRLAFLPRETRMEARKLLRGIFGSGKAGNAPRMPHVAKTVEAQRVLPNVVQGMMRDYEKPEQYETYISAIEKAKNQNFPPEPAGQVDAVGHPAGQVDAVGHPAGGPVAPDYEAPGSAQGPTPGRPKSVPLTAQDIPRLAKSLPAFQTTGVAHAFMYEPDEEVQTITKNDGLVTSAESPDVPRAPQGVAGKAPGPRSSSAAPAAPAAASSGATPRGAPAQAAGNGSSGKPLVLSGSVSIEELPGYMAQMELRVSGLEEQMGNSNG